MEISEHAESYLSESIRNSNVFMLLNLSNFIDSEKFIILLLDLEF